MNHEEERCNTTLGLGIGVGIKREKPSKNKKRGFWLDLSLPLHPKIEASDDHDNKYDDQDSFSFKSIDDQEEQERRIRKGVISNVNVSNNNDDGSRKKLKFTTEQTTMLEDRFNIHSTLNTGQKQALAKKLNLLPRQIEVWFQNRRARTKLKQIEKEYELIKKSYETLNEENQRLKKELQEVRCSLKSDHHQMPLPFFVQYTTTTATTMHHRPCDKIGNSGEEKKAFAVMNGGNMDHVRENSNKKNATAAKLL